MKKDDTQDKVITDTLNSVGVTHPPLLRLAKMKFSDLAANEKCGDILSAINEWAKTEDIKKYILAPVNSGGGSRGGGSSYSPPDNQLPANWDLWAFIPQCEHWQAVALSIDLEPPKHSDQVKGWPSEYDRRLKITSAHIECKNLPRSKVDSNKVDLSVFGTWAKAMGWSLPQMFPREDEAGPAEKIETDYSETLAALFDPVPVTALERIFPAGGKWKGWAERAARNGLVDSRVDKAMFNPYKAAMWFVNKGEVGFALDRCNRILANNLPPRSMDKKHLLIGDYE